MTNFTRRGLVGGTAAGAVGLIAAQAAAGGPQIPPDTGQPAGMLGAVKGDAVTLPPLQAQSETNQPVRNSDPFARKLGVAVVGLGHLALQEILPGFASAEHVKVTALVSGSRDKARAVAAQYNVPETGLYGYDDFDRIKDNPAVDIVYIVLPNAMHREWTERAAAAGKHVLCEKPMSTSSVDAQAMVDAVKAAGKLLMIAYRCQYEPYNRTAIKLARGGELGELRLIEAVNGQNNANNGQWRHVKALAGGGSLPDVGLYCLNAARYITGEEPVEISARITQPKDDPRFREIEDICSFDLRFPSGVMASCSSGYSIHETRRMRVIGSTAWADLDPAFAYRGLRLKVGRKMGQGSSADERTLPEHSQFALEMDHFADAIRLGRTPRTPGEEGLQDMRLIEAIYRAGETGRTVKLAEIKGRDVFRGMEPSES